MSLYINLKLKELPDSITAAVFINAFLFLFQSGAFSGDFISSLMRINIAAVVTSFAFVLAAESEYLKMGDVKLLFPIVLIISVGQIS